MRFLNRHFEKLGLAFIAVMIALHVIALRDEGTISDSISVTNGLVALGEIHR